MRWFRYAWFRAAPSAGALILCGCSVYAEPPRFTAQVRTGRVEAVETVDDSAFGTFNTALAPYGQWLDAPVCGRSFGRVWRPSPAVVGADFVPYGSAGQWVATDQGWFFESDFDWGWAPFHYGRWCDDARFGWVWVPGSEWAPSWVDWRSGGGYVGWAPLPPVGVGLSANWWIYADQPSFTRGRVTRYGLPRERVMEAERVARPVGRSITHQSYSWPAGPSPTEMSGGGGSGGMSGSGGQVRPVHVAPPARGSVGRVIVRSHP